MRISLLPTSQPKDTGVADVALVVAGHSGPLPVQVQQSPGENAQ